MGSRTRTSSNGLRPVDGAASFLSIAADADITLFI